MRDSAVMYRRQVATLKQQARQYHVAMQELQTKYSEAQEELSAYRRGSIKNGDTFLSRDVKNIDYENTDSDEEGSSHVKKNTHTNSDETNTDVPKLTLPDINSLNNPELTSGPATASVLGTDDKAKAEATELIKGGPMSPRTTSEAEPQILPPIADATEKELNESKEKGEEKEKENAPPV
jgi:hypothetical protein